MSKRKVTLELNLHCEVSHELLSLKMKFKRENLNVINIQKLKTMYIF